MDEKSEAYGFKSYSGRKLPGLNSKPDWSDPKASFLNYSTNKSVNEVIN